MTAVVIWFLLMPVVIWLTYVLLGDRPSGGLGMGYGFFALVMVPFVVNFLLLRLFAVWRITDCPYCGFHEKQKLGLSESGEL